MKLTKFFNVFVIGAYKSNLIMVDAKDKCTPFVMDVAEFIYSNALPSDYIGKHMKLQAKSKYYKGLTRIFDIYTCEWL